MAQAFGSGKGLFSTPSNGFAFKSRRRRANAREVASWKASLAEFIANGGSARKWATANGLSQSRASQLWRQIVADLGWQAQ